MSIHIMMRKENEEVKLVLEADVEVIEKGLRIYSSR